MPIQHIAYTIGTTLVAMVAFAALGYSIVAEIGERNHDRRDR